MRGKKINALIFRALIFKRNFLFYSVDFDSTTVLGSTLRMSPCNTLPGPSSVNSVTPSASMFFTMYVQRTGAVSCAIRLALIVAGSVWGLASTFW